jgi:hypothetical protein
VQQSCQGVLSLQPRFTGHDYLPCGTEVPSQVQQSCQGVLILLPRCTSHAYPSCGLRYFSGAAVMPRCPEPGTQVYQPCLPPLFTEVLSQVEQSCQDVLILQVRCTSHAYLRLFTEVLSQVQQSCQGVLNLQVRCTSHAYLLCEGEGVLSQVQQACQGVLNLQLRCSSHAYLLCGSEVLSHVQQSCQGVLNLQLRCTSHAYLPSRLWFLLRFSSYVKVF